ncbi:MAG TPA: adenosylhomocysteinase, partial [Gemmatimonadaceae bacterium]
MGIATRVSKAVKKVTTKITAKSASKTARPPFKVADLSLADWGRKEIRLAEQEMPGLMSV